MHSKDTLMESFITDPTYIIINKNIFISHYFINYCLCLWSN